MFKAKPKYIGLDVGGTKILMQTFSASLEVMEEKTVKTVKTSEKAFLAQLNELIDSVFYRGIKGIGIAVPGIVKNNGILKKAPHLPTKKDLHLKKRIENRYKRPVHLDNDVTAFVIAESKRFNLEKHKNILGLMVGTGVGGAAIVNGEVMYGKDGYAGEFGHMFQEAGKTLEQLIGGIFQSKTAAEKSKELAESLAIGLSNLNHAFNPSIIVLGGSMYHIHLKKHKPLMEKIIKKYSLSKEAPRLVDARQIDQVPKGVVLPLK